MSYSVRRLERTRDLLSICGSSERVIASGSQRLERTRDRFGIPAARANARSSSVMSGSNESSVVVGDERLERELGRRPR
jgi:hypothetical protein